MKLLFRVHCTVLFVCIALAAIGQGKSARVADYLGKERFETEAPPAGVVKFVFDKATLKRNSDGKTPYASLLKGDSYFTDDDNAGALKVLTLVQGGREVLIGSTSDKTAKASLSADPVRPRGDGSAIPTATMPDSLQMALYADNAISTFDQWKASAWTVARPIWRVVMYVFSSIIVFLFVLGAVLRYIAKTASMESAANLHGIPVIGGWIVSAQQSAAGGLLLICWIVTGITMINIFMWLIWLDYSIWWSLAAWLPVQWLSEKITNWLVPNIRIIYTKRAPSNDPRLLG